MDQHRGDRADTRPREHVPQEMLPQIDAGIAYQHAAQQAGDLGLSASRKDRHQGDKGEDRGRMAGGKAGKPDTRDVLYKIGVVAGRKELLGSGHGEQVLQDLGDQRREQKGGDHLGGMRPMSTDQQNHKYDHGEKTIPQKGDPDKDLIQCAAMIGIQVDEGFGLAHPQEKDQAENEKEEP